MLHSTVSDRDLVRQVLGGRTDAYAQLVERHIHGAHAIAYARAGNVPDAEDAVQEAFLRALEKLRTLRDPAKFGSWLLSIARHEAVRLSAERVKAAERAGAPRDTPAASVPDAGTREMNERVREQVMRLPGQHREVLLLHYYAGRTTREIAGLLDIRQGAVLKRLQRAREQLAVTLLKDLEAERPSSDTIAKQVARILELATAATVPAAMSSSTAAGAGILSASVGKALAVAAGLALTAAVVLYMGGALGWNGAAEDAANHAEASNPLSGPGARGVERPSGPRDSGSDVTLAALEEESTSQVAAEQRAADEPAANEPAGGEPAPTLEDTLNATMGSLAWEHVHLRTPLKQVEDQFGIRIQIDRRVVGVPVYDFTEIEPATVPYATSGMLAEVNLHELPLSTAVDLIASELGLQAVWEPGYVWMSTRDRILREVPRHPAERFEAYANKDFRNTEISAEFIDVHVRTVVEWLNNAVKGANIVVDYRVVAPPGKDRHTIPPRGKATDGVVEYVHLRDIRLDETLRLLCRTLNLTPVVQSGYLWLSTPELIRSDGLADAPPNLRTRMDKTLQQPVSIVFQDLDLHDSFGFVRAAYNINIVVDQRAIAWKPEPASARPLRGAPESAGMSHGMIYCISIENVTLRTYLDVLTRQLGLAFAVQDDAIVVSSRERLDAGPIPEADLLRPEDYPTIDAPVAPPALKPAPRRTGAELPQRAVLRSIQRSPDGDYRVEMDLAGTGRSWFYKEGDAFGEFKLEKIDAEAGCITLLNEKTGETFRICLDDPAP